MNFPDKTDKPRALIFSVIALALAVIATAGRLFSLLFFYDEIGYYESGALIPVISNAVYALAVCFFAVSALLLLKPKSDIAPPNAAARYASLLPALAIALYLIFSAGDAFAEDADLLTKIGVILAVISASFFISLAFCRQPSVISVLTGVGCIFWVAVCWFISYRDFTVPMNSPDKLFFHFGCIGAVLFIFSEIRAIYSMARPKFYYFSIFTAILSLSVSSIPSLIANASGAFASYSLSYNDLFFLALTIYAVIRLITLALGNSEATEKEPAEEAATEEAFAEEAVAEKTSSGEENE